MRIIISYAERRELSTHILSRDDKSKKKEDQLRSQPDGFMDEIQTQYAHTASYCATKMRFGPNDREQERKSASERNNHSKKKCILAAFYFPYSGDKRKVESNVMALRFQIQQRQSIIHWHAFITHSRAHTHAKCAVLSAATICLMQRQNVHMLNT